MTKKYFNPIVLEPGTNVEKLDALINLLWGITHDTEITREQMLTNLCFAIGITVATLMDYKRLLEEGEV